MIANAQAGLRASRPTRTATTTALLERYPGAQVAQLRRPARDYRDGRADRLSADAGHAGRLLDLRRPTPAGEEGAMDTYHILRDFADSWVLLACSLFFVGVVVWAFRPGSREGARRRGQHPLPQRRRARTTRERRQPTRGATGHEQEARTKTRRGRDDRPFLGRDRGVQQPAAALVAVDLLRHDRLGRDLHDRSTRPGRWSTARRRACWASRPARTWRAEIAAVDEAQRRARASSWSTADLTAHRATTRS